MSETSQGFWSYVHKDDDATYGAIRTLAEHLRTEFEALTGGHELHLFLDTAQLQWGDEWRTEIEKAVTNASFFIPLVTPSYFASAECRKELLEFAEQAKEQSRKRLVMPIYYIEVDTIERGDDSDPLVPLITESKWEDWRNLRYLDQTSQPYRMAVGRLAARLKDISEEFGSDGGNGRGRGDNGGGGGQDSSDTEGGEGPAETGTENAADLAESEPEQLGLLELLAAGEESMPRLVETLTAISDQIKRVGSGAESADQRIHESDAKGGGFKGRLVVANEFAKELEDPAQSLEVLGNAYVADLVVLDPAVRKMIELAAEQAESPDEVAEFFEAIEGMADASSQTAGQIAEFVDILGTSASFSRELGRPLRRMRVSLQSLIDGHEIFEQWKKLIAEART